MENHWLSQIKKAKKSSIVQGNLKKIHYAFEDGRIMVEEYNTDTNVLSRRAWKIKTELGGDGEWDVEIGDPEPAGLKTAHDQIRENPNQPFITRRITRISLEWRIRNLPYQLDVFSVTADGKCLIVRTTNKKYYKKISIPELDRVGLLPQQENVSFTHKFNTLIITYKKPQQYIDLEKAIYEEVKNVVSESQGNPNDCRPS